MKLIAFDTEDDSCGEVKIINFFDGTKHYTFEGGNLRERAWDYLNVTAPAMVWACNAEYDLINLFGDWLGKMVTLQYVKSGLIRGSFRDAKITFYDTLRHWPISVKEMGKIIGLEKIEVAGDFINVKYCRRDTEIVWHFVSSMLERYEGMGLKIKATLPAMALQLFGKDFTEIIKNPFAEDIKDFFRLGYYGGRVEVFQFGEINGLINHYDYNSLYPSVMREFKYPDLFAWKETVTPDFNNEGIAEITIEYPEHKICCLPVRTELELLYPYGTLRGAWCYPEIRQAIEDGGRIKQVHRAIEFNIMTRPFVGYVEHCYNKRLEAKAAGSDLDNVFWKLMLNSLYGKFAQSGGIEMIYDDRHFTLDSVGGHVNVIWSAYVTCYGRLKLLKGMRSCKDIYYTDTDSLFCPDLLPEGKEIGELKKEGSYSKCEFVGNKIYTLENESKAKGVPKSVAGDFIRTGQAVYRKPARFRESRRTFATANKWYTVTKKLKSEYIKRKILSGGKTRAWDLREFYNMQFIKDF